MSNLSTKGMDKGLVFVRIGQGSSGGRCEIGEHRFGGLIWIIEYGYPYGSDGPAKPKTNPRSGKSSSTRMPRPRLDREDEGPEADSSDFSTACLPS
ncbi:MAG: hypothetical protein ABSB26_06970 [Nitrososphaerales archaeon]